MITPRGHLPAWPRVFDSSNVVWNAETCGPCERRDGAVQSQSHQVSMRPHGRKNQQTFAKLCCGFESVLCKTETEF